MALKQASGSNTASASYRCRVCTVQLAEDDVDASECCPGCRSAQPPVKLSEDVRLDINWQDLRLMLHYAQKWAEEHCDGDSAEIFGHLEKQYAVLRPSGSVPLTLAEELEEASAPRASHQRLKRAEEVYHDLEDLRRQSN